MTLDKQLDLTEPPFLHSQSGDMVGIKGESSHRASSIAPGTAWVCHTGDTSVVVNGVALGFECLEVSSGSTTYKLPVRPQVSF